jgi:hypothetical protein
MVVETSGGSVDPVAIPDTIANSAAPPKLTLPLTQGASPYNLLFLWDGLISSLPRRRPHIYLMK